MSQVSNTNNCVWKLLTGTSKKHLCFGFVRQWLHLINIDIQVNDIANIILNYALTLKFGFIHNPNYSNVFFKMILHQTNLKTKSIPIHLNLYWYHNRSIYNM